MKRNIFSFLLLLATLLSNAQNPVRVNNAAKKPAINTRVGKNLGYTSLGIQDLKEGSVIVLRSKTADKYMGYKNVNSTVINAAVKLTVDNNIMWRVSDIQISRDGVKTFKLMNYRSKDWLSTGGGKGTAIKYLKNNSLSNDCRWTFMNGAGGAYKIKNQATNLFVAIEGGAISENAKVISWEDEGQQDLLWYIEEVPQHEKAYKDRTLTLYTALTYIAVSEVGRNRIDNHDCRKVFGDIKFEINEIDGNKRVTKNIKSRLLFSSPLPELRRNPNFNILNIFDKNELGKYATTKAASYYQDDLNSVEALRSLKYLESTYDKKPYIDGFVFPVSEEKMKKGEIEFNVSVGKNAFGTFHKDNDLASFDALVVTESNDSRCTTGCLEDRVILVPENIKDRIWEFRLKPKSNSGVDDEHKVWIKYSLRLR